MPRDPVDRYLGRYAEPEAHLVDQLSVEKHSHCLVIPAYQESLADIESVTRAINGRFLLILIVNSPQRDAATLALLRDARELGRYRASTGNLEYRACDDRDLLIVDRCSEQRIPPRQGVGLARKIGADIALRLMTTSTLTPGLIHMTDADARLPATYFEQSIDDTTAALLYPFRHETSDDSIRLAALLYEISLLYYVLGLRLAGSHYAWPTIGSTLAVNYRHYALVRGFPRRNAAEDFYLQNKLAKTGHIRLLEEPAINIVARPSTRVPFGTGPAINRISTMADPVADFDFYHPEIFLRLRALLTKLDEAWDGFDSAGLPGSTKLAIEEIGLAPFLDAARDRCGSKPVFDKAVRDWFDAFRTLKFIHLIRDHDLGSLPLPRIMGSELLPGMLESPEHLRDSLAARCFDPTC